MNLFYAAVLCVVSAQIKGVHPKDADLYRNHNGYFYCLGDPSIKIPYDRVNDDYCDCPDGSDEPGTSACSKSRFWCANKGHVGSYIPSRFVNDGKCDYDLCCDGSDEAPGVCANRCEELAKEAEAKERLRKEKLDSGLKAREVFVLKAQELRKDLATEISGLESQLEDKKFQLRTAVEQLRELEKLNEGGGLGPGLDPVVEGQLEDARRKITMAYDIIASLKKGYEQKRVYSDQLANVLELMKRDYNPNFNDAAVKQAINSFEDATGNIDSQYIREAEQLLEVPLDGADVIDSIDTAFASYEQQQSVGKSYFKELTDQAVNWLVENSILPARKSKSASEARPKQLTAARELVDRINKEIDDTTKKVLDLKTKLETVHGPDDVLRALQDVCVKHKFGEYEYNICYYNQATQSGNGQFSVLGNHKSYRVVDDHLEFKFTDGAGCWNGPPRSANVIVRCGEANELLKVEEIEKCVYSVNMLSPVACFPEVDEESEAANSAEAEPEPEPAHSEL